MEALKRIEQELRAALVKAAKAQQVRAAWIAGKWQSHIGVVGASVVDPAQ